ncbi:cytoskeleton-associated protein 4 [Trichechus manatus latirostris]|uniref:Cytoskeleton-associated protein 4 n=1 Tax=Trichechus manatus latirostris TaxID=127582 RepID=A0A2Y9FY68_TRIMA|nr:cytoskeleton-associated protein 4 [Trichechus manatus latirostris]
MDQRWVPGTRRGDASFRIPDCGKPLAARSLAQTQRDVNSSEKAPTLPPPEPEARGHSDTRCDHSAPAPRSLARRQFEVKEGNLGGRAKSGGFITLGASPVPGRGSEVGQDEDSVKRREFRMREETVPPRELRVAPRTSTLSFPSLLKARGPVAQGHSRLSSPGPRPGAPAPVDPFPSAAYRPPPPASVDAARPLPSLRPSRPPALAPVGSARLPASSVASPTSTSSPGLQGPPGRPAPLGRLPHLDLLSRPLGTRPAAPHPSAASRTSISSRTPRNSRPAALVCTPRVPASPAPGPALPSLGSWRQEGGAARRPGVRGKLARLGSLGLPSREAGSAPRRLARVLLSQPRGNTSKFPGPRAPLARHQHQHNQAHGKGGHRGGGGGGKSAAAASSSASCSRRLGKALNFLFYLALVAAAAFSGWCVHHVLEEVQQVRLSHQDFSRQREELGQGLQGVEQKVQSLQATFGTFESILRSSQHKQDLTEKAVKQGESEINRISEVLQKLQNEILKDLSDGIHVVKDARERDFTSLENTVEERLTELTKSINDNIAIFTEVQKRSQKEINDVKAKVASLEESEGYKQDLKAMKEVVKEIQTSLKSKEKDLEALRSTLQTMESDVYTEVKELVSLKQEQQKFKEVADMEHVTLQTLTEKILQSEESISRLPGEIRRLEEELHQLKADSNRLEEDGVFRNSDAFEALQRTSQGLDSRLQSVEDGVQSMQSTSAQQTESLESLLSKSEEYEQRLSALQERVEGLGSSSEADKDGVDRTVRSLGEAQLSLHADVEELKRSVGELPSTVEALQKVQEQVHSLLSQDQAQAAHVPPQDYLDKLSSLDNLKSSVSQVESDLKMLRTAVDSLVAYSVKIETNENNLESAKALLDDLRNDLDRLFVKVEKIHEKI